MPDKKRIDSKEFGLVAGLVLARYLFKTNDLHYGYWPEDLKVDISNLVKAQENHSAFVISHIPSNVETILDVGCGAGSLAKRLLTEGYKVDCVSPSGPLSREARRLTEGKCDIFESTYEALPAGKTYDLVVFSESFQYIDLRKSLDRTMNFLKEDGHMLICDFFKTEAKGKSAMGGGHRLVAFYDAIRDYPFTLVEDIDITKRTSPNLDLTADMLKQVGLPIWELLHEMLSANHPLIYKLLCWKYRKKIGKMNHKYFSGARNGKDFETFKSYRLILCRKTIASTA